MQNNYSYELSEEEMQTLYRRAEAAIKRGDRLNLSPLKNLILFFSKDKNQIEKFPLSDFFPDYNLL